MAKIILKGPKSCQWDLGKGFRGAGIPLELTAEELKKAEKDNLIENYLETKVEEIKEIPKEIIDEEPEKELYTKEILLNIASAKGISGLREIGDKFGVKFRSIDEGISEILEAQK